MSCWRVCMVHTENKNELAIGQSLFCNFSNLQLHPVFAITKNGELVCARKLIDGAMTMGKVDPVVALAIAPPRKYCGKWLQSKKCLRHWLDQHGELLQSFLGGSDKRTKKPGMLFEVQIVSCNRG